MALPPLALEAAQLSQLDLLYQVQNLINAYVIQNILLLNQSPDTEIVAVINPNLYQLAVQYYGNADWWPQIAMANNLTDPLPQGTFTLLIPPRTPVSPQGILNPPVAS